MEAMLTNPSGRMTLGSNVVRIGSAQDNHVVINDPKVAPYHAEIRPGGDGEHSHTIIDLGSTTGTYVNVQRLDYYVPALLHPNDTIYIGDAVFNYEVIGAPSGDRRELKDGPPFDRHLDPTAPSSASMGGGTPQVENAPNGDPGQVDAAGSLFPRRDSNLVQPQDPSHHYPFAPASLSSGREEAVPYAPYVPAPTGGIAPASPLGSGSSLKSSEHPTYTVASLLKKENRRKIWFAAGLTALVILVVAFLFGSFHSPARALDSFCSALQSEDYQAAYNQLSPGLQGLVTEASFADSFASNRITTCTHSSPNVSGNSAMATLTMNSRPASTVWLIQDSNSNWRIDNLSGL